MPRSCSKSFAFLASSQLCLTVPQQAILEGTQPSDLALETLIRADTFGSKSLPTGFVSKKTIEEMLEEHRPGFALEVDGRERGTYPT